MKSGTLIGMLFAGAVALIGGGAVLAQQTDHDGNVVIDPAALFNARCKSCHDPAIDRAPNRAELGTRPPANIRTALTTGSMAPMAAGLSAAEISALAEYLGQRSGTAMGRGGFNPTTVDRMCATHPPIRATKSDWASFGVDKETRRYQPNPGLTRAQVPKLKVKWAFSLTGGSSYGQPTVVGDWLFITVRGGNFYALDAKTGCVHWKVGSTPSRTTPLVLNRPDISPSGWMVVIGDQNEFVRAYDAQTGKELWASPKLETHAAATITASIAHHGDQLFVPMSSLEEGSASNGRYPCCSFRGSLIALDIKTGRQQWKSFAITEPMRPMRINSAGAQMQGPAGAAIWSAPTVDVKRSQVYVTTGDSYTEAPTIGADAVIAYDMKTGAIRWQNQVTENDNFIAGCLTPAEPTTANCPRPPGPDWDFGASAILMKGKGGKDIVVSGQKSARVYGMDADTGKLIWSTQTGTGGALGGVEWGMAADDRYVFAAVSDIVELTEAINRPLGKRDLIAEVVPPGKPGIYALDPATGKIAWTFNTPKSTCSFTGNLARFRAVGCINAQSAAPSVTPGLVWGGSMDGWMRALDARSGKVVWEFSATAQTYDTTNGVRGQPGGGFDSMGPAIAGGMMFVVSGYNGPANVGGNGTNVLLAFSVDGK